MMENVRHHVKEEESTLFPALRKHLTRARLVELGDELVAAQAAGAHPAPPPGPGQPTPGGGGRRGGRCLDKARDLVRSVRS